MKAICGKNLLNKSNISLGFFLDLKKKQDFNITVIAKSVYKIIVDKELKYFGPMRSAHGYARSQELKLYGQKKCNRSLFALCN